MTAKQIADDAYELIYIPGRRLSVLTGDADIEMDAWEKYCLALRALGIWATLVGYRFEEDCKRRIKEN